MTKEEFEMTNRKRSRRIYTATTGLMIASRKSKTLEKEVIGLRARHQYEGAKLQVLGQAISPGEAYEEAGEQTGPVVHEGDQGTIIDAVIDDSPTEVATIVQDPSEVATVVDAETAQLPMLASPSSIDSLLVLSAQTEVPQIDDSPKPEDTANYTGLSVNIEGSEDILSGEYTRVELESQGKKYVVMTNASNKAFWGFMLGDSQGREKLRVSGRDVGELTANLIVLPETQANQGETKVCYGASLTYKQASRTGHSDDPHMEIRIYALGLTETEQGYTAQRAKGVKIEASSYNGDFILEDEALRNTDHGVSIRAALVSRYEKVVGSMAKLVETKTETLTTEKERLQEEISGFRDQFKQDYQGAMEGALDNLFDLD